MRSLAVALLSLSLPGLAVGGPSHAKVAVASFECVPACTADAGATLTFRSTSTGDGGLVAQDWDLDGDGAFDDASGPSVSRGFPQAGSFVISLRVVDSTGASARVSRTIVIGGRPATASPATPVASPAASAASPAPPAAPLAAPALDEDDDGVEGAADLCPRSVGRSRAHAGCTAIDLMIGPAQAAAPVLTRLREVDSKRTRLPHLDQILALVRRGALDLPTDTCEGDEQIGEAAALVRRDLTTLQGRMNLRTARLLIREWEKGPEPDADALDLRLGSMGAAAWQTESAAREVLGLARATDRACDATRGRRTVEARVESLDADTLTAELTDGTTLVLGGATEVDGLVPGTKVSATGLKMAGGTLVATEVDVQVKTLQPVPCDFTPTIAPVQDFGVAPSAVFHLDHRGYLYDGVYRLEGGAGVGAVAACNTSNRRLHLTLTYRNTLGKKVTKLVGTLFGNPAIEKPAVLPLDVQPGSPATLHGDLWEYECTLYKDVSSCDKGALAGTWDAAVELRPQGGWARVSYDRLFYSVEDGKPADFDVATLGAPQLKSLGQGIAAGSTSFAIGYGLVNSATTYPHRQYVVQGQQFALHDDLPSVSIEPYLDDVVGVPGGLFAAYLNGTRGGHQVQYLATLPHIVTDRLTDCAATPDEYYRLPWQGGTVEKVTQQNNTEFTHNGYNKYAYDFRLDDGEQIRAPRGGVVWWVQESYTETSNPKIIKLIEQIDPELAEKFKKPANSLYIRHQDASMSVYFHMQPNGVQVEKDDVVERGDKVAIVGNTGNSTGAHLHYQVDSKGGTPNWIRFEVGLPGVTLNCVDPQKLPYISTNY